MPPKTVPENTIGLPIVKFIVVKHVIKLLVAFVIVAAVVIAGRLTVTTGLLGYPLITPYSLISRPGGNVPSSSLKLTGLLGIGLLYMMGNSIHTLSNVSSMLPSGVIKLGNAEPDIVIVNNLSLIAPLLSVALMTNENNVSRGKTVGVPDMIPLLDNTIPVGKDPEINVYETIVAGLAAVACNVNDKVICDGNEPIEPTGVIHVGCTGFTVTFIVNVFALVFPKLSVAVIMNV